jgi:hypothetical protein
MRRILLFVEDYGHEEFITALIERLAHEKGIGVKIIRRSVRGGHGKVITEFRTFLRYLERERDGLPDLLIVATDANCKSYAERKFEAPGSSCDDRVGAIKNSSPAIENIT